MPRLLIIAYYFPPLGGPASIRAAKTSTYLKKMGWDVDVITVKNILYHSYDHSLAEKTDTVNVIRAGSCEILTLLYHLKRAVKHLNGFLPFKSRKNNSSETGNDRSKLYFSFSYRLRSFGKRLFLPDEKIGWIPFVYNTGTDLLKRRKYDFILAGIGPYSSALAGYLISKQTKVPLIVDYRDLWTMNPYESYLTPLHKRLAELLEKRILNHSTQVTVVGEMMKSDLLRKFSLIDQEKISVIYNGFDEEDFSGLESHQENEKEIVFSYLGNFYAQITPYFFLEALKELKNEGKLSGYLRIRFIGNYHRDIKALLIDKELEEIVQLSPQIPHNEAVQEMVNSDALLLFIPSSISRGVITSKVFEYLRAEKPILAMLPDDSEAVEIMNDRVEYFIASPESIKEIKKQILLLTETIISQKKAGNSFQEKKFRRPVADFSRENQTLRLDKILRKMVR